MRPVANFPAVKDLVLVGGGHSHAIVLKIFGMKPLVGLRITVVSRDVHTPYSGMLPGLIAGLYSFDECHIDLRPLANFAGATLIHAPCTGIDVVKKEVIVDSRPPIPYDILSIDIGVTPSVSVPGAAQFAASVKPIDKFVEVWERILASVLHSDESTAIDIAVVGGGAGGVEITLAMHQRLTSELLAGLEGKGDPGTHNEEAVKSRLRFTLFNRSPSLLSSHSPKVAAILQRIFKEKGIRLVQGSEVVEVQAHSLLLANGQSHSFHHCVWCTQAGAAPWLASTGLQLDPQGFISVDSCLQSVNTAAVFAVGDIHSSVSHPREKAGVIAVRQGQPLAENLRRSALGLPLKPFVPQSRWLSLISCGGRYAIASWGRLVLEGALLWKLKNYIDTSFMRKLSDFPAMHSSTEANKTGTAVATAAGPEALAAVAALSSMRCKGCGAKVGSSVLSRVLNRLRGELEGSQASAGEGEEGTEVVLGVGDDAAAFSLPAGMLMVQTVDYFPSFTSDLFLLGQVAANHSLGDCYAMGARPVCALAIATLPHGVEAKLEGDLVQMLSGALLVLRAAGCALVGGHTSEGSELSLGFCVTGAVPHSRLLTKGGLAAGHRLILTKAIGTGTILAADAQLKAKGRWVEEAFDMMRQSSMAVLPIVRGHGAVACTDVTGFGLAGHLLEMVLASEGVSVDLWLSSLPVLSGAEDCVQEGIVSSLHASNARQHEPRISSQAEVRGLPRYPLLFDPQTSGGLLVAIPDSHAQDCLLQLRREGFKDAAIIAQVKDSVEGDSLLFVHE